VLIDDSNANLANTRQSTPLRAAQQIGLCARQMSTSIPQCARVSVSKVPVFKTEVSTKLAP